MAEICLPAENRSPTTSLQGLLRYSRKAWLRGVDGVQMRIFPFIMSLIISSVRPTVVIFSVRTKRDTTFMGAHSRRLGPLMLSSNVSFKNIRPSS